MSMSGNSATILRALKNGIEFLGNHPFATGFLALLGMFGVIFSIVGYQVDRNEAADTANQIDAVSRKIEETKNLAARTPSDLVPKFKGVFDSRNSEFIEFATKNEGKIVHVNAYIPFDSKINTGEFEKPFIVYRRGVHEFHYYYKCPVDFPPSLENQKKETYEWRSYCKAMEMHVEDPKNADAFWEYRHGSYVMKGYWALSIPGAAMGAVVVRLSPVHTKDAY